MLGLQRAEPNLYELPVEQLAEYVGRYETRIATVELTMNESGLLARVIPQGGFPTKDSPVARAAANAGAFFAEDAIVALDSPWTGGRAEFLREPSGGIAWLRWGGRLAART